VTKVFRLKNAKAASLAKTLERLYGASSRSRLDLGAD
jgi:hypothetical protein